MENLNLKIETLNDNELIVRQGEAPPPVVPLKMKLDGNINAVSSYLSLRKENPADSNMQTANPADAIVLVDEKAMTIKLLLDPISQYGGEVTARLDYSDELKEFNINGMTGASTMTKEVFVKLLRFNRLRFLDHAKHEEVFKAVQAFAFKAQVDASSASDTRGNRSNHLTKSVESNIPDEFILVVPIFKGQKPKTFRVDVCLDTTEGSARFWLESTELAELIEIEKDRIFTEELKNCDGFVIIRK